MCSNMDDHIETFSKSREWAYTGDWAYTGEWAYTGDWAYSSGLMVHTNR